MAPLIEIQDLKQHFKIKGGFFGRNIQTVRNTRFETTF